MADLRSDLRSLGKTRVDNWLSLILATYLLVVALIVGYNVHAVSRQRGAALNVNVAARQRALAERYVKDVLLVTHGHAADPQDDAAQLRTNADALLSGGDVIAVQGADADIYIEPVGNDDRTSRKLLEERRLIDKLIASGDLLIATDRSDPAFERRLNELRVIGAQVTSVSNDAVGQMTRDTETALARLVAISVFLGILGAIAAITMALLLRRLAARRSARFRSLVHNASDLILVVDAKHRILYGSPSVGQVAGTEAASLIGTDFFELIADDDVELVCNALTELTQTASTTATLEYRMRNEDGTTRAVESIVSDLLHDRNVRGLVLNTRDVTDRKLLEEELAHQAFHDSLTGLSNRAVFRDRLDHALARSGRNPMGLIVLLLDLDGFKMINDSLGHDAGDRLLVDVANRLQGCARSSDTVARLGGDEFAVLLEDELGESAGTAMADRLMASLTDPFDVRGVEVFVRASIGIAMSDGEPITTDELIRNADTAMYAAKVAGKARYEVFRPVMHTLAVEKFQLQADLQRAVANGEFLVMYQPIVDFSTGNIGGMEALVRWVHPDRGVIAPIEFIATAEETGLIVPLGAWVLREACRRTAAWRATFPDPATLWVSVNLSTRQLIEPDLPAQVQVALEEADLEPSALVLEITEGSLLEDIDLTTARLHELKSLGVRLAIDDFGTGSSSLGYLRRFPIDVLKIDKSFVDEVADGGAQGQALVRAIVQMARTLELDTVAEGIEVQDQLVELRSAGCSSGQGYLFARPLASDAMEAFLRDAGTPLAEGWDESAVAAGRDPRQG